MNHAEEVARLQPFVERARGFSGWDLGFIGVRLLDAGLPWDYEAIAAERVHRAGKIVDFGTGGGEVLARVLALSDGRAGSVIATEQWRVNAPLARDRLRPLGVPVLRCDSERPPLRDASVDLVLSRHEAIDPAEVDRVLTPGGRFLTQQVTPDVWSELRRFFPRATVFPDHYRGYARWFEAHGYGVTLQRHDYRVAWASLGELVVNLLVTPWTIPDFDVARDIEALLALEAALTTPEG
ncbi:MAG: class I SAM-dependent methyltransferase, partial [Tepidiformaceae bacterium]